MSFFIIFICSMLADAHDLERLPPHYRPQFYHKFRHTVKLARRLHQVAGFWLRN